MADFNIGDLEFILAQIKIAEQNATKDDGTAGTPLDQLVPNSLLPWGLRTVDGTFNNITADPDRSTWALPTRSLFVSPPGRSSTPLKQTRAQASRRATRRPRGVSTTASPAPSRISLSIKTLGNAAAVTATLEFCRSFRC